MSGNLRAGLPGGGAVTVEEAKPEPEAAGGGGDGKVADVRGLSRFFWSMPRSDGRLVKVASFGVVSDLDLATIALDPVGAHGAGIAGGRRDRRLVVLHALSNQRLRADIADDVLDGGPQERRLACRHLRVGGLDWHECGWRTCHPALRHLGTGNEHHGARQRHSVDYGKRGVSVRVDYHRRVC